MHLTCREKEILCRVFQSQKHDVIADELGIHPRTVHYHLSNVRRKLGVQTSLQIVIFLAHHPEVFDR